MSAVIEELKVKSFEGYKKGEVKFTDGLNLIKGRNSAGKSTLLDALLFAIYGEIPGTHKKLLVSRLPGRDQMAVYVKFKNPMSGSSVEVFRSGGLDKNEGYHTTKLTLRLNRKEVEVESDEDLRRKVTENIGISLRKFVNLVYVRQGSLQDILEPRKEDMDLILRLTVVRELKEQMDDVRKTLEKYEGKDVQTELQTLRTMFIPQLQATIERFEKDIAGLETDVRQLEDTIGKAESPELLKLLEYVRARGNIEEKLSGVINEFQVLLSEVGVKSRDELLKLAEDTKAHQVNLKNQCAQSEEEVKKSHEEWVSYRGKVSSLQDEIDEHEGLLKKGVIVCPTCGQDLKAEKLQEILKKKREKLQSLRRKEEKCKRNYERENENSKTLNNELDKSSRNIEALKALDTRLQGCVTEKERIESDILGCDKAIETGLKGLGLPLDVKDPELKVKVAQRLPLDPDQLETKKGELRRKKTDLKSRIDEMDKKKEDLEKHVQKTGELEEMLEAAELARQLSERLDAAIETRRRDVLKGIEDRALSYYKRMTDQHDYDSIRIDPETYVVSVHPKNLVEHIPAKRDGGGHQTLLALAVRLALLETLGFRSLLILDEPTYGVDSENLPQLADYLEEASKLVAQTILVTHHDICEEEASNIIEVGRDEDGASRVQAKF